MKSHTSSLLPELTKHTVLARDAFYSDVSTLPTGVRSVVIDGYEGRIDRCHGKPLLGEIAPVLLGSVLHLDGPISSTRFLSAWMNLYAYTLFIDDILDGRHKSDMGPLLLASGTLLERGISSICSMLPSETHIRLYVDQYCINTAEAALNELMTHHDAERPDYEEDEIARLGEKVSLLKLCASCLLVADGKRADLHDALLAPIGVLATGMQLLDDITDWHEDWRSKNNTYLLTRTFNELRRKCTLDNEDVRSLTAPQVFAAIVYTGSLDDCIARGVECLRQIAESSVGEASSIGCRLLEAIIQDCTEFHEEVVRARDACISFSTQASGPEFLKFLATDPVSRRTLLRVRSGLTVIATHS